MEEEEMFASPNTVCIEEQSTIKKVYEIINLMGLFCD